MKALLIAIAASLSAAASAQACGAASDCVIGERTYRIAMPDGHDGSTPIGAIIHAHGYRGTAQGVMRNKSLRNMANRLGVALIAPKSKGDDWVLPGAPRKTGVDGSAEFQYFDALVEDVAARFPIDKNRLMVSGFSAGGMMVWNLACHRGEMFAGFAPIAGTFWEPLPKSCPSKPVNLIHTHGTSDKVVPMAGRPIADTKQGEIEGALALFMDAGDYKNPEVHQDGDLNCARNSNAEGRILEICLHDGGHSIKSRWLERAWHAFEKVGAL